jgi:hypothetical protein
MSAGLHCINRCFDGSERRQHYDDGAILDPADGSSRDLPKNLDAIHFRHHQVEQDDLGLLRLEQGESFMGIGRSEDLDAFLLKRGYYEFQTRMIIVNG